jgi:Xaa-Pro aminopeptidase
MSEPYFPKEEYDLRHKKARELMAEKGLDALLATNVINYTYLGGHRVLGLAPWTTRPFILILPKNLDPMLIGQHGAKESMEKTSNIKKIKFWSSLPFTIEIVKEALEELNLADGRIGCELGLEERLGISYNDFISLQRDLPKAEFVDASELFLNLRVIKSQAEIKCIRRACEVTSKAYEKTFNSLETGMNPDDVQRLFFKYILEERLSPHFMLCRFWHKQSRTFYLKKEGIVWVDGGAVCKGYRCDFSRMIAIGSAPENVKYMYTKIRDITWKLISMVNPGVKVSDIAKACIEEHRKAGLSNWKMESIGRIGHGLGLGYGDPFNFSTELPSINCSDNMILKPGMVITLEPGQPTSYGYFTLEEDLVVTENGYELLSEVSDEEIRVI